MKRSAPLALLAALAACAAQPAPAPATSPTTGLAVTLPVAAAPAAPTDPLAKLAAFTLADLTAASADAHAQTPPDQTAYQCYDFLIKVIPTLQPATPGGTVGAIMGFQKLRDLQSGVSSAGGNLKNLNLACAPLVIDTQTTINRLALIAAGGAATGGALGPALGGLGAIGPTLPIPLP